MPSQANMLIKIRDIQDTLTPVNKQVAAYVLQHPERVIHMSIRELALQSKASDAAVMRFCKSAGISGYRELIIGLSTALGAKEEGKDEQFSDIQPGDDLQSIIRSISYSNRQSIEDTLQVLRQHEVQRAVDILRHATRIAFFGIGASGLVAMDAQQKFARIGRMCHAHVDGHDQLTSAVLLSSRNAAVVISNSGETREIMETAAALKQTNAKIIALTRRSSSSLGQCADVVLNFSTPEITIRSGAMGSRIAMLNIVDILYAGVASSDYGKVERNLKRTREIVRARRTPG